MEVDERNTLVTYGDRISVSQHGFVSRVHLRDLISFCLRQSKYFLLIADCLLFALIFELTCLRPSSEKSIIVLVLLTSAWVFIGYVKKIYSFLILEDSEVIMVKLFHHYMVFLVSGLLLYFFLFRDVFTYMDFATYFLLTGIWVAVSRIGFLSIRKRFKFLVRRKFKAAIINNNAYSEQLEQYFSEGISDYKIVSKIEKKNLNLFPQSNQTHSDIYYMSQMGVSEIFCGLSGFSGTEINQLIQEADKYMIRVKFLPDFSLFNCPVTIENFGNVPVIAIRAEPLSSEKSRFLKRAFDILFSLLVIVFIMSWLIPLVWIAIRIESKGSLFFKQKRSGLNDKVFNCYKFRSMVAVNPTSDTVQATRGDTRVTKVGAFLRKTSLDELPQFFNVLAGNMSVVGPRPHMLAHDFLYRQKIGQYMVRHYVKPGITGLAQIKGFRGGTLEINAMQKRIEQDIRYIETWSFFLDLKIIFVTGWDLIQGDKNAY